MSVLEEVEICSLESGASKSESFEHAEQLIFLCK